MVQIARLEVPDDGGDPAHHFRSPVHQHTVDHDDIDHLEHDTSELLRSFHKEAGNNPVVDQCFVNFLPQDIAQPQGAVHKYSLIQFVQIILLNQQPVQEAEPAPQADRNHRIAHVEIPCHRNTGYRQPESRCHDFMQSH